MKIGTLAQQTGASIRSLRYYDEMGLLSTQRSTNGYRCFDPSAVAQVLQIRALLTTGFRIADIRLLLPCLHHQETGSLLCPAALDHYRQKLATLDEQIHTLQEIRQRIAEQLDIYMKAKNSDDN